MKIKHNKGYVGVDLTISLMILIILIPTITAMTFNINSVSSGIKRKTEALSIATNVMESAKVVYEENKITSDVFLNKLINKVKSMYIDEETDDEIFETVDDSTLLGTIDKSMYRIKIDVEEKDGNKAVVNTEVRYKIGNKEESVNLKTNFGIN